MDSISRNINNGIVIEKVNLVRATLNEAFELKDNLTEDGLDYNKIIVDLSCCDYIDSTFFGALVYSYKKIKENDGKLILVINESSLAASFIYKEISSIFEVYPTVKEAIARLKTGNEEVVSEKY